MSGQLLELIIFAAIAIFAVNKLISILGSTSDDDPAKQGNNPYSPGMKNVDSEASSVMQAKAQDFIKNKLAKLPNFKKLIVNKHKDEIINGLNDLQEKLPNFALEKFVSSSKVAFDMIVKASMHNNDEELANLIDSRYLNQFKTTIDIYQDYKEKKALQAEVAEVYTFGNNLFIKILFTAKELFKSQKNFAEEWTFSRSSLTDKPNWYLTNIDRPS